MKTTELRGLFQREVLPDLFLNHEGVFYNAFNKGEEAVYGLVKELWAHICNQDGDHVNNHPLDFQIRNLVLDDTDDGFKCLMVMEMPYPKRFRNLAVYVAVFFGVKDDLRLFLGETDYQALGNRYIFVIELMPDGEGYARANHGFLFRGCNNEPFITEAPENRRRPDFMTGIDPEDEWAAFVDRVAQVCLLEG